MKVSVIEIIFRETQTENASRQAKRPGGFCRVAVMNLERFDDHFIFDRAEARFELPLDSTSSEIGIWSDEGLKPQQPEASDETNARIDQAIRELIARAFSRAQAILRECASIHKEAAQRLLEKETFLEEDLTPIRSTVHSCAMPSVQSTTEAGSYSG